MTQEIEVKVPNIGDFKDVEVIEILVKPGDRVARDDALITLESDKATMEIPSAGAGVVGDLKVKTGDRVSEGSVILTLKADANVPGETLAKPAAAVSSAAVAASDPASARVAPAPAAEAGLAGADMHVEVVVLGAGPGGYTAAFRAADLGKKVVLIERYPTLGGVCLNVGCIPSKALLHVAKVISEAEDMAQHGVVFGKPKLDIGGITAWKQGVVDRLTKGLSALAKQRKVTVVQGTAQFASPRQIRVSTSDGVKTVSFDYAIIAAGSQAARIPGFPYDDPRLMDSTGALQLGGIPKRLLVVGGGIIGLEMATVYDALGSKITVVELLDGLIPGCDRDLVRPLARRIEKRYEKIYLKTRVERIEPVPSGLKVFFVSEAAIEPQVFDRVLVAVGRRPNGKAIGAENAGVIVNERGLIPVDKHQRTNVPHIFAIGDIVGEPMLAHKATHEAKVAAEVIAGQPSAFDARTIPNVAYTDPEVAWMGMSEDIAKAQGIETEKAVFPWAASGRSLGQGRDEGLTKLIFDKNSRRLLGAGIVGPNAGELISETVLALEMGADAADIGLTIHPHPTLSETIYFSAEIAEGSITDLYMPKERRPA